MGCSASAAVAAAAQGPGEDEADNRPIPPPTSFEIPLDPDSLIKKHPPKRLERLARQLPSPPPQSISDLSDKLANAELRRQTILRERVNNIRNNLKKEGFDLEDFNEEVEENALNKEEEEVGENEKKILNA